ncbi:MAG: RidA family protein [Bacillota bacterium]|jgi:2-iminobutanoate/2-iminopropanoate deaminase
MIKKIAVTTNKAPAALGPYSLAIQSDELVFTSGQLGINAADKKLPADIAAQTRQALENISHLLEESGCSINHVLKTTIFLTDLNDFDQVNEVYGTFFQEPYPARSTFQVAALPAGAKVEIEAIARK